MRRRAAPTKGEVYAPLWRALRDRAGPGPQEDSATRQRTALTCAAYLLVSADELQLARWLLRARPEAMTAVASGVAAHALRRGLTAVWDVLAAVEAFDLDNATELFDWSGDLVWTPKAAWLYELTELPVQLG